MLFPVGGRRRLNSLPKPRCKVRFVTEPQPERDFLDARFGVPQEGASLRQSATVKIAPRAHPRGGKEQTVEMRSPKPGSLDQVRLAESQA